MAKVKKDKTLVFWAWWNKARRYNYRQAFEKILFTMIGLWLALGLNNWNDGWKKQRDERTMLKQIESALQQDLQDIAETMAGYQYRLDGCGIIKKNLHPQSVMTDSLLSAIQSMNGFSFLSANKGGYETLKSRGLDLIQNDSLRLSIATLYEVDYLITERSEAFFQNLYSEQMVPYLFKNMKRTPAGLEPLDWVERRRDNYFHELVNGALYNNQNILGLYKRLGSRVTTLSDEIQKELDR